MTSFRSVDARTRAAWGSEFLESSADDVARITGLAARTFRPTTAAERAAMLRTVAGALEADATQIVAAADRETALGVAPRLEGELVRTTSQLLAFARYVEEGWAAEATVDADIRRMQVPIGPVAVFGASNFPLAFGVAGGDTAAALAAGCPVVAKGHPSHPLTSALVATALQSAVPDGWFSIVMGPSPDVGRALVAAPAIRAVGFTGSLAAGRALYDIAAARPDPIPVYAEMGSVNPLFVLPHAAASRSDEIASGFVASMTQGGGQFCTKPGIVVVPDDAAGTTLADVIAAAAGATPTPTLLNDRVRETFASDMRALGVADDGSPAVLRVSADEFLENDALSEEHFGPFAVVVQCEPSRVAELASAMPGSLTATVHADATDDAAGLLRVLTRVAGRVIVNGYPTGVAVVPAMQHGGPYPATTFPSHTSVGVTAIRRFQRPVAYQSVPDHLLPPELQDANPLGIPRFVDWEWTRTRV